MKRTGVALLAGGLAWLGAATALAQPLPDPVQSQVRPGDEKVTAPEIVPDEALDRPQIIAIPDFVPEAAEARDVLPPLELPERGSAPLLAARIDAIRVTGNTVLDPSDVARITRRFEGRTLAYQELDDLRDALTRLYVDAGYVTSGATIPPQSVRDGVLEVRMREGRLGAVEIENAGRLREAYVRDRLELDLGDVVHTDRLRARLVVLQRDPRIESVHAELVAGSDPGSARLHVRIVEARAWWVRAGGGNLSSPLIGEWRGDLAAGHRNALGFGDSLEAEVRLGETLRDVRVQLGLPVGPYDTALVAFGRRTWSEVILDDLDVFDIESATESYGVAVEQPVYRTLRSQALVFFGGEWRRSRSYLLGRRFSFTAGPENGVATIAVLRGGASFEHSGAAQAFAVRTQLSVGLDALDATTQPGDTPDGQFVAWLSQLQYVRRLPVAGIEAAVRAELQWTSDPLLGLEQFAIGGGDSVRGFRENHIVRDNGVVGSAELRIPIPLPDLGGWRPRPVFVPFVDTGHGWNTDRPSSQRETLVSAGVGLRAEPLEDLHFGVFWANDLDGDTFDSDALQDSGVGLELVWLP